MESMDNNQGLISKCQFCLICNSGEDDFVINNGRNWSLSSESCSYQADPSLSTYSGVLTKNKSQGKNGNNSFNHQLTQRVSLGQGAPTCPGLAPSAMEHPEGKEEQGEPIPGEMQDPPSRENPPQPPPGKELKPEGAKFLFCVV